MNTINLILTTGNGDEIGRLPLTAVQVTGTTSESTLPSDVHEQITKLYSIIGQSLEKENLQTTLDEISLHMTVSRALMAGLGNADIDIHLPVMTCEQSVGDGNPSAGIETSGDLLDIDDLFFEDPSVDEKGL